VIKDKCNPLTPTTLKHTHKALRLLNIKLIKVEDSVNMHRVKPST